MLGRVVERDAERAAGRGRGDRGRVTTSARITDAIFSMCLKTFGNVGGEERML